METISNYNIEIIFGLVIAIIFLLMLFIISQARISSITKKYDRLVEGVEEASLEDILMQHLDDVKEVKEELVNVKKYCEELEEKLKHSLQKIGFIRYNAFSDMGSDLSFSIALLDETLSGFIVTSIYGRDESNMYAKPIVEGKSDYTLSVEEMQVLDRAMKKGFSSGSRTKIS